MVRHAYCFNLYKAFFFGILVFSCYYMLTLPFTGSSAWRQLASGINGLPIRLGEESRELRSVKTDFQNLVTSFYPNQTCDLPGLIVDGIPWPECLQKVHWMKLNIDTDSCYKTYGLSSQDDCSILTYLSTLERYCPPPEGKGYLTKFSLYYGDERIIPRYDFADLYHQLAQHADTSWISQRISSMEEMWKKSTKRLFKTQPRLVKKRIHIHLGLIHLGLGKQAWKGGPLGELVQWSDVIASMHSLGHDIVISSHPTEISHLYKSYVKMFSGSCTPPSVYKKGKIPFDIIYTDISGYKWMMKKISATAFATLRCRFRIVDSFGTEAVFNHPPYRDQRGIRRSQYNGLNLKLPQFNTMFPHTPDNTFLGFVTEFPEDNTTSIDATTRKKTIALIYGKSQSYFKGKETYLSIVREYVDEVHATVRKSISLPSFVINHGVVDRETLGNLLQRTKIFVGLGFPFEGPAPLEAIQHGAVFLNPKFNPPISSLNHKFYQDKPTRREISSQNPYAETYIGDPYVFTVDIDNEEELRKALSRIARADDLVGHLVHEFSAFGMLERLGMQIEKQQFCTEIPYQQHMSPEAEEMRWPPVKELRCLSSFSHTMTCNDICSSAGLICEPSFFPVINRLEWFRKSSVPFPCNETLLPTTQDSDYPAFDEKSRQCYLQSNPKLFSCAGNNLKLRRLCPCRDYVDGQVALCKNCGVS